MRRFSVILLTIHYTIGTLFLPEGNFLYLSQIPDIYRQYEFVNGKTDFLTFVEENFLEFENKLGIEDENEPFENEEQQIPFKTISINVNPAFSLPISEIEIEIEPQIFTSDKNTFYLIKKYTTKIISIFHPPIYSLI